MSDIPNREELEKLLAGKISKSFSGSFNELMRLLGNPPNLAQVPLSFWDSAGEDFTRAVRPTLTKTFEEGATRIQDEVTFGVDWAIVKQEASSWAAKHSFDLVQGITATGREALQKSIAAYYNNGLTMGELQNMLSGNFSPIRAEMIAVTEVTRASSAGELMMIQELKKAGISIEILWATNNDDLVCPICGPRNNKRQGEGWLDPPPAHPRCRCWLNERVLMVNSTGF